MLYKGFKLIDIPEKNDQINSTVDFLVEKNSQKFLVECKTLINYSGHPIEYEAANSFLSLIDKETYENRPEPLMEYIFDKKLTRKGGKEDQYTPSELAEKYHKDFKEQNNNIQFYKLDEGCPIPIRDQIKYIVAHHRKNQSMLLYSRNKEKGTLHYIRLISEKPNKYTENIKGQIEYALKQGSSTEFPLLIYIQLECPYEILKDGEKKLGEMTTGLINKYNKPTLVNICTQTIPYSFSRGFIQDKLILPLTEVRGYGDMMSINNSAFEVYKCYL